MLTEACPHERMMSTGFSIAPFLNAGKGRARLTPAPAMLAHEQKQV